VEKEFARRGIVYGQRSDRLRQSAASRRTARSPERRSSAGRLPVEGNTGLPDCERPTAFVLACGVDDLWWRDWSAVWA
jgi:hypothetical protein